MSSKETIRAFDLSNSAVEAEKARLLGEQQERDFAEKQGNLFGDEK